MEMIIRNNSFRLALVFFAILFAQISFAENDNMKKGYQNPYLVKNFTDPVSGNQIDEINVPPSPPPAILPRGVALPFPKIANGFLEQNIVSNVPRFTWCYGCSATSAAMMMGHYDNTSIFTNMYTGPTDGGVCPMINETWGYSVYPNVTCGECPISASHNGIDGRTTRAHVDDYWIDFGNADDDPYITGSWTAHASDSCGDFMGTSQSAKGCTDGSTTFFYYTSGAPTYDYTGSEPSQIDGCHGIKLYVEHCGYNVEANGNYNQYIYGYEGNTVGFTFDQYKAEIDAGRPVLIQLAGHTMLGVGYIDATQEIYVNNTWDHETHLMTWGGSYSGMAHYGVTVIKLLNENYDLDVVYGSGDGSYAEGTRVNISANSPEAGKTFDKWIGDTAYLTDVNSATTVVTMPTQNVTVMATYELLEGLIAYYALNETNLPTVIDSSILGFDGLFVGNPQLEVPSAYSYFYQTAVAFDESFASISSNSPIRQITNNFTVAMWVNPKANDASKYYDLLGVNSDLGGWSVQYKDGAPALNLPGVGTVESQMQLIDTGRWTHIAFTFDAANHVRCFINGIVDSGAEKTLVASANYVVAETFIAKNSAFSIFVGAIDEVRVYSGVLSDEEVAALAVIIPEPAIFGFFALIGALYFRRK